MKLRRRRKAIKKLMNGRPVTWREWRAVRLDTNLSLTYSALREIHRRGRPVPICWIDADVTTVPALLQGKGESFAEWKQVMLRQIAGQFCVPFPMLTGAGGREARSEN